MSPVRNQIIFGGCPLRETISKKSASKVTMVKPFSLAKFHILLSWQPFSPTFETCLHSAKLSGSQRIMRNEIFWSNSNFISYHLQITFTLCGKSKTCENVPSRQFGKINENFIVGHTCRQPSKHIVYCDAGFSYARLAETLLWIDSNNIGIFGHNHFEFKLQFETAKIIIILTTTTIIKQKNEKHGRKI